MTISRIWRALGLQPHRTDTFKLSPDPLLIEKVRDIVGLYMNPPNPGQHRPLRPAHGRRPTVFTYFTSHWDRRLVARTHPENINPLSQASKLPAESGSRFHHNCDRTGFALSVLLRQLVVHNSGKQLVGSAGRRFQAWQIGPGEKELDFRQSLSLTNQKLYLFVSG